MKIGILCAGDREAAPFFPMLCSIRTTEKAMLKFVEGRMENVNVVVLFSGVCKVNAAIAAQVLIDTFHCEAIINAGTAGALSTELQLFDTAISTEAAYHDVDEGILTEFHPWMQDIWFKSDEGLLQIARAAADQIPSKYRTVFGRMVTGEAFIADDMRERLSSKYQPLSVDMETAAVAHVCYVNRVPFIAVRTMTDTADHSSSASFEQNCTKAAAISAEFVRAMLSVSQWGDQDEI